ncbi:hypothetical protein LY90DRAFT_709563 [Neocallimastix californiae]|jgi:hypothetical protein|uniref:Dickkopf N-terminal cysteine-rich domain-containing protein n=1 Tax=Neocallimastix californiae TaxID=1754190 RepID=A0A1Y1YL40_9FUNG|nr:hypothetical protein LY90DRAFT_709563 [Neocallimastix californiae]|eukprot:ORX98737.1 hypothetical protein LY90DRAFT_709563 [Neocallimastix californiae]
MNKFSFISILSINIILTTLYQLCEGYCYYEPVSDIASDIILNNKSSKYPPDLFPYSYYYCRGNKCYGVDSLIGACGQLTNNTHYELANENEIIESDGYDEKYFEKITGEELDVPYANCSKDSDCFSEKCVRGHCIFERNNPVKYCHLNFNETNVRCGVPLYAYCKKNEDCFTGYCHFDKDVCVDYISFADQTYHTYSKIFLAIKIIIILLILLCIFCCFKTRCCHTL